MTCTCRDPSPELLHAAARLFLICAWRGERDRVLGATGALLGVCPHATLARLRHELEAPPLTIAAGWPMPRRVGRSNSRGQRRPIDGWLLVDAEARLQPGRALGLVQHQGRGRGG